MAAVFFAGQGLAKTLGAISNPVGGHGHQSGVLRQDVGFDGFQGIGCGVVGVAVVGRILVHVDAGQTGTDKRAVSVSKLALSFTLTARMLDKDSAKV